MRALLQTTLIAAMCSLALSPHAYAKKRVAVKADASPAFEAFRGEAGDRPLSYIFAEGEFFGDSTRGTQIKEVSLRSILETLAEDFAVQNFYPTTDTKSADMLIVVHWGGIERLEDPTKFMALERAFEGLREQAQLSISGDGAAANSPYNTFDPSDTRFELLQHNTDMMAEQMSDARIARILGFDEDLAREREKAFPSTLEETLLHQMQDERYLVIVMAWDNRALSEKGEKNLLWSTRISMRALGSSFDEAVALMSGAAAPYFGQESGGLQNHVYRRQEYKVEMGEVEVVESGKSAEDEIEE
ncbi:hypothetical protein [Pelagicoccus sp. SDUM812003]|uniref:hypothetical protein n=1 Tax=Pelagicoccus sp. SDUM812003 TaxID=3041267 RepID=UPI00280F8A1A|nr:hypothetical protein [Pelagicoccus sp. SDUM812003]MDQ8205063.1 hypothetical protein [Pelagicoccus sp. SDUM812003]